MERRHDIDGTYLPLLQFARRSADISEQHSQHKMQQEEEQEQQHLEEEQKEEREIEHQKESNENGLEMEQRKLNIKYQLETELAECLRQLSLSEEGILNIKEILNKANIPLSTLYNEEKGKLTKESKPIQESLTEENVERPTKECNTEGTNTDTLSPDQNSLNRELVCVKNNLHSCTFELSQNLPRLTNALDANRRELLLPLYRLSAMYSSTSSERVWARRQLLSLYKHPSAQVRKSVVTEWLHLLRYIQTQGTLWTLLEREILPELFLLANSRLLEQRLLALECVRGLSSLFTCVATSSVDSEEHVITPEYSTCVSVHQEENTNGNQNNNERDNNNDKNSGRRNNNNNNECYYKDIFYAVQHINGLLYNGLLRPLCDDASATVREEVVICVVSLWPTCKTINNKYFDENNKVRCEVELEHHFMEIIIKLALDAASGTVRHLAQSQLRRVIFVKSFHSGTLLSSFVPLLFAFIEREVKEMVKLRCTSASTETQSEAKNDAEVEIIKMAGDQNAQSVFAHTRPGTLIAMLNGNVNTLMRLVHDALKCAVQESLGALNQKQELSHEQHLIEVVEERNDGHQGTNINTENVTDNVNVISSNRSSSSSSSISNVNGVNDDKTEACTSVNCSKSYCHLCNASVVGATLTENQRFSSIMSKEQYEANRTFANIVLPSYTQMVNNVCVFALHEPSCEHTYQEIICRLSYTVALFCKLFDWPTWLQVKEHLMQTLQNTSEWMKSSIEKGHDDGKKIINNNNSSSSISINKNNNENNNINNNNKRDNTLKSTHNSRMALLRLLFAFLLRVSSKCTSNTEERAISELDRNSVIEGNNNVLEELQQRESHDAESIRGLMCTEAAVCFVCIVAEGIGEEYNSDECFHIATLTICSLVHVMKHDNKLMHGIRRLLKVMYNFAEYNDSNRNNHITINSSANINNDNVTNQYTNVNEHENDYTNKELWEKRNNVNTESDVESCELWCIVFIVNVCSELRAEEDHFKSTVFCAFLHHLIENEVTKCVTIKVKEEVMCALMQTVLPLNDANEQLALLTPVLEKLREYHATAHIFERVLHVILTLIPQRLPAETRETIIYPFLEAYIVKLSQSRVPLMEISSVLLILVHVLEAILRCAVVTPSLVNEHLLQPMIHFTSLKVQNAPAIITSNTKSFISSTGTDNNVVSTKSNISTKTSTPSIQSKWLETMVKYQDFVERNKESGFASHLTSSPLFNRVKDELKKRFEY